MYHYALVLGKDYENPWFIESQEPIEKQMVLNTPKGVYIIDSKGINFNPDSPKVLWILSAIPADDYIADLEQKVNQLS